MTWYSENTVIDKMNAQKNDNTNQSSGGRDPVPYLNEHYEKFGCLPTMWEGQEVAALADELRDLPGLKPEVNFLLKMFK